MNKKQYLIYLVIAILLVLTVSRGLMRTTVLAGHDTSAYPVTQHQFHQNIKDGVIFPRWAPDMRYGFGHIKLQYRPPVLHYVAEFFFMITSNYCFSINLALIALVSIGAGGMFLFSRKFMDAMSAMISVTAYLTANYILADIYLRGAYYEVAAYVWMPWILWSQAVLSETLSPAKGNETRRSRMIVVALLVGAVSWCFLICGHPQIATFFMPVALSFMVFLWIQHQNWRGAAVNLATCITGILLSAPYLYVAVRELPNVRMQLFYTGLEDYYRNFLSVKQLLYEEWPTSYRTYTGHVDYLGRPLHQEMRGLNVWAVVVLLLVPCVWFWSRKRDAAYRTLSEFFYVWIIATVTIALPISWGVWELCSFLHTFNFPWRSLAVTTFCVAFLTGFLINELLKSMKHKTWAQVIGCCIIGVLLVDAFPHTRGWAGDEWMNEETLNSDYISRSRGIPQQFYTPRWVRDYPIGPARRELWVTDGVGSVKLTARSATRWEIDIDAKTVLTLQMMQHYYPGWLLHGIHNPPAKPIINPDGTMAFTIPEGKHHAVLSFDLTNDRVVGYVLAILGAALLAFGCAMVPRIPRECA